MTFLDRVGDPPAHLARPGAASPPPDPSDRMDAQPLWTLIEPRTWAVALMAVAAAIVAILADCQPTGLGWWDALLCAATAAGFTVAMSASPRTVTFGAAIVAAVFVGSSVWLAVALLSFAIAALAIWIPAEGRVLGAMTGALSIQALFRLDDFGFFGFPSLVAGVTILAVLLVGLRSLHRSTRRVVVRVAIRAALGVAVFVAVAGIVALSVRNDAEAGMAAARRGLDAARQGDTAELTSQLEEAEARLSRADGRLGSVFLQPLRLVPIVAQHHQALSVAAHQGALVAEEAATAATEANVDELRFRQGQFDLALLESMAPQLERTASRLEDVGQKLAEVRSGWLLGPVDDRLVDVVAEIDDLLPEARLSADAARVMPAMLGAEAPRRYLMLFGSPGESRELGGFTGSYALIELDAGDLALIEAGRSIDMLNRGTVTPLDDPGGYPTEFRAADPVQFPQNLTATPDIAVVARAVRDIFPDFAGAPIDGVIYADPYAIAAMVEFTGPLAIEGSDVPLDSVAMVEFLLEGQYRQFEDRNERFDAIDAVFSSTFDLLSGMDLPGPERLGEVLGPAARQGRLQVVTYDEAENEFLRQAKLQRKFVAPAGIDSLAIVQSNFTASKLDLYLERTINYRVEIAPSGELRATVDVRLFSNLPPDAPPYTLAVNDDPTTNRVLLSLYTPHQLSSVTVDGADHRYAIQPEYGFNRFALFPVSVPAGGTAEVRFELGGTHTADDYRLALWHQPLVNQDMVQIDYLGPDGTRRDFALELNENTVISAGS